MNEVVSKYFRVEFDGTNWRLYDLGTSQRSQSYGQPGLTPDRFQTREGAEAHARDCVHDRGED